MKDRSRCTSLTAVEMVRGAAATSHVLERRVTEVTQGSPEAYQEPFVRIVKESQEPSLSRSETPHGNEFRGRRVRARRGQRKSGGERHRQLMKGAAGQAVQCMNSCRLFQTTGLVHRLHPL
jgi:N-acetyl-gamma-glutamylphosphate reductase